MKKNDYFIDVSSYQPADLRGTCLAVGTENTIIKVSEHTSYLNPNKDKQADTSNPVGYYHFARFGGDVNQAIAEANYFLGNLPSKQVTYLVLDYEDNASGDINANTQAILAFMDVIAARGYKPIYYSYKPYTLQYTNYQAIISKYSNSLWIAAYADYAIRSTPDGIWDIFPSMDGVRWWQFTSSALQGGLDKNIVLLDDDDTTPQPQSQTQSKNQKAYRVDDLEFVNGLWQVKCYELVPINFDWTQNGIACGDIIITDAEGNRSDNQVTHVGDYFVFDQTMVSDTSTGDYGDGGYYWRMFNLTESGSIWLSAWDLQHLLFG